MKMPTTLIFGGSGKVARQLTKLLTQQESPAHTVYSIIRNPDQKSEIEALGGKPLVQSIEDSSVADFVSTIQQTKPDTIVWSAGAGGGNPERTIKVDRDGAIKSMDAAAQAGVKRYIIVSAIDVRDREKRKQSDFPDWYDQPSRERSDKMQGILGGYLKAKFEADKELRTGNAKRQLDYTIVRPGGLSMDPSKGTIAAGKVTLEHTISREDVAKVIIQCIKDRSTIGLAFDVVGGNMPIPEAIAKVATEKIDTFEGFY